MKENHLWPQDILRSGDSITVSAILERPDGERRQLWYRLPETYRPAVPDSCDALLLGVLFSVMKTSSPLHIHGTASPALLSNLSRLQEIWAGWMPEKYTRIDLIADREQELSRPPAGRAVMGFSGGCDSAFTAWRHCNRPGDGPRRNLVAGVFVHGFDIPLTEEGAFSRAAEGAGSMLASLGMELIPIATNFRSLGGTWDDAYGAGLASCLMLLQGGFDCGLIASSYDYPNLHLPAGSNPLTDRLMSSGAFEIVHDGAEYTKIAKVGLFGRWPAARCHLRVCWEGEHKDSNCGRCLKCVKTILIFRINGLGLPECFAHDVRDRDILRLRYSDPGRITLMKELLMQAQEARIRASWVRALEVSIWINRLRWFVLQKIPARGWMRRLYRRILPPL